MSDSRHTNFVTGAAAAGLTNSSGVVTGALNQAQLDELLRIAYASGCKVNLPAVVDGTYDTFVLAPAASQTNTITVVALKAGPGTGIVSVAIADNGSDALAVTNTAGVVAIALANTTDANNTLTLLAAAIHAANSSTLGVAHSVACFITGTASTQMVHGGTNTRTAVAAGGAVGGGLKSSTAGVAQAPSNAAGAVAMVTA